MGRWAVTTLLRGIDADGKEPPRSEVLSCPLVRRASVGPPPRS
jgi:DNA-binding LacI/PurR family transcriptional regulator